MITTETQEEVELASYIKARGLFSYDRMRKEVGVHRAIQYERKYQGERGT